MIKNPEDLLKLQADAFNASGAAVAKSIEHFEKLAELNLKVASDTFTQSAEQVRALLAAKDPQQAAKLIAAIAQPSADTFSTYAKELYALSSKTGAELVAAAEKQIADGNSQLLSAVELLAKNAPGGSEGAVQILRNAVSAANTAYDQVFKATRQLAEQADAGLASMARGTAGKKAAKG